MATLTSIQDEIQLSLRITARSYDPFQADLEWLEYEVAIRCRRQSGDEPGGLGAATQTGALSEVHSVRGKINSKDFRLLLDALRRLASESRIMKFEPYDLNFYFEWSIETENVCLIASWFDLGLIPRRLDQRFPTAHKGFRFLAERSSVSVFCLALEKEFHGSEPLIAKGRSDLVH